VHLSFACVYCVRIIYFELAFHVTDRKAVKHALRNRGSPGSVAFVFAHLPLTLFLLADAIGLKLIFKHFDKYHTKPMPLADAYFVVSTHAAVQVILAFIRVTHQVSNSHSPPFSLPDFDFLFVFVPLCVLECRIFQCLYWDSIFLHCVSSFCSIFYSESNCTHCHYIRCVFLLSLHFHSSLLIPHSSLLTPHSSLLTPHSFLF